MTYARLLATGSYLPERSLSNADLEKMVDTNDAWITARTGIKKRHIIAEGQGTVDLAENAARAALEAAGMEASELDLIVLATTTPDNPFPSTACLLQQRLGVHGFPAFDIQAVCSGFIYALSTADSFIRAGNAKKVLVVGAESLSRLVDWTDRGTCVLFGDGAGAVILEASEEPGILSTHLHADGRYYDHLAVNGQLSGGEVKDGAGYISMRGNEVFKFAVNNMSQAVLEALAKNDLNKEDIDWLVPHQANQRIINAVGKKLKLSADQVIMTVAEHGNTSAASVPLALDTGIRDGRIQRGQTLVLEAMGGGFTWGSAILVY